MFDASNPIYSNETAAREHLEGIRWGDGVYCPHCGGFDGIKKLGGAAADKGLWHCKPCRKKFTVTVGTVFERSHIALTKWLAAFHLMCASKKGISAHQGHRMLGVTYKTAWFMWHRIREAMKAGGLSNVPPMGGKGKVVEADETYFHELPEHKQPIRSNPEANRPKHGPTFKRAIVSLVERGGTARSFYVGRANVDNVTEIVRQNVAKCTRTRAACITRSAASSPLTRRSIMARRNTLAATFPRTPLRVISACSSAACAAPTSTAASGTCTATSRSSISGSTTAAPSA